jgi:hypothetical protein
MAFRPGPRARQGLGNAVELDVSAAGIALARTAVDVVAAPVGPGIEVIESAKQWGAFARAGGAGYRS